METEQEVVLSIGTKDGDVVVDFGTSLKWLRMSPDKAITFAELITAKAHIIKQGGRQ